jgi:hypothetical protein
MTRQLRPIPPLPPAATLMPSLPKIAALPLTSAMLPLSRVPSFGPSGVNQLLDFHQRWVELWTNSAQTIALRFWLAPPWLVGSAWVRDEWWRMTSEKVAASGESMTAAMMSAMEPASWGRDPLTLTTELMLAPYTKRTSGNARRLASRALLGPLPLLAEAAAGARRAIRKDIGPRPLPTVSGRGRRR